MDYLIREPMDCFYFRRCYLHYYLQTRKNFGLVTKLIGYKTNLDYFIKQDFMCYSLENFTMLAGDSEQIVTT